MTRILILAALFLFQQEQAPEEGKPASCDNFRQTEASHRCDCARDEQKCNGGIPQPPADVSMDAKCSTYCRKQNCKCVGHGCAS